MLAVVLSTFATLLISLLIFNFKAAGKRIEHEIKAKGTLDSDSVKRSMGQLLGPPLIGGNKVTLLDNGDEIFPSMLQAIRAAERSITFETYIYWSGQIGQAFADALSERSRAGVRVHVLVDWIGSQKLEDAALEVMTQAGIQIKYYRPLRWYNLTRLNNRTHRKILVVDGKIGFTGGVGIADQWLGNAQDETHWRDAHFRVEGPVVAQLQSAFMDNWNVVHPEVLHGEDYFPAIEPCGNSLAQVFKSSPEEGTGSVRLMYLYAVAHATRSIRIASAYFVPDSHLRKLLVEAKKRGVQVEVILPGTKTDVAITRMASRAVWDSLLAAGIKIFEYQPTMYHCKYMIVDELWVSVGSTNLDSRSFRLNDECNLNVIDREWASALVETFAKDRARSREIARTTWRKRSFAQKALEWASSLFESQV